MIYMLGLKLGLGLGLEEYTRQNIGVQLFHFRTKDKFMLMVFPQTLL